jgi:hypothetical protein
VDGTDGLGGGGGGGGNTDGTTPSAGTDAGGDGGDGVVIVRYLSATPLATGGTVTSAGGYQYHTFTTVGGFALGVPGPSDPTWLGELGNTQSGASPQLSIDFSGYSVGDFAVVFTFARSAGTWPAKTGWSLTTANSADGRPYGIYSKVLEVADIGVVEFPGFSSNRVANAQIFSNATAWSNMNAGTSSFTTTWKAGDQPAATLTGAYAAVAFSIRTIRVTNTLHSTLHQDYASGANYYLGTDGNSNSLTVLGAHKHVADASAAFTGPSFSAGTGAESNAFVLWVS